MEKFTIQITRNVSGKRVTEDREVAVLIGTSGPGAAASLSEADIDLRRLLGLPITKDLVYYPSAREDYRKTVDKFEIDNIFNITEPWFTLKLFLGDSTVRIHHRYFAEMQSPSFIADMHRGQKS